MKKRFWNKGEKIAIIKEVEKSPTIVEVLRHYNIANSVYYKWKREYDAYGEAAFENRRFKTDPEVRRLEFENQRLKKLLAEKELENELLQECLKKRSR